MARRFFMQICLLPSILILLSLAMVTSLPLREAVYDNEVEELVEGRNVEEIAKLIQNLDADEDIRQIYLKFHSI